MKFKTRRLSFIAILAGIFFWLFCSFSFLREDIHYSGWLLLVLIIFLASYNIRKKLTYPPLMKSSTWLQLHIYVAWLCLFIFLYHTGFRLPDGHFEIFMASIFWGVALSGIIGLILTRVLPNRLRVRGEEVLFERIPIYRRELREKAEQLILRSVQEVDTRTLADFYKQRLAHFFNRPGKFWSQLFHPGALCHHILEELRSNRRYLNDKEKTIADELEQLIQAKDHLDYHLTLQGLLKYWFFVHIPLTYVLLLCVMLHVILVHAFYGGA